MHNDHETLCNGAPRKALQDADLTRAIIMHAIEVHSKLGPGLLETVYEACLAYELTSAGYKVERQKHLPVIYKGLEIDQGFRMDLVVENRVIIELKCVEKILPIHEAQLFTYLKLSGLRTGLLINFYTKVLKDGLKRIVC